ncbi:hypothetical protein V1477_004209 [Vespula maculifrons]|uniref:Uncharacterized protein n=1 Tax=Vespula maculifrons TaxID=7453 RepID=A0ABD2CQZ9_VESMC
MILVRGVASTVPIERLSQRVNIFLNTKHMHILWGPMCVSPTMIGEHDHAYNLKIYPSVSIEEAANDAEISKRQGNTYAFQANVGDISWNTRSSNPLLETWAHATH